MPGFRKDHDRPTLSWQTGRMAGGSAKAVYVAIGANSVVMVAKFSAFFATGSPSLLSEGIHSLADVGNQTLLALGIHKSKGAADDQYPMGLGKDRFIWALISAVGIFFLGCGVTLYHGVHALLHPATEASDPRVTIGVLIFAFVIEGYSLWVAIKAVNVERAGRTWGQYFRETDDPMGPAILMEDGAAVLGVVLALVGVVLSQLTGIVAFDAIASILIALLLGVVAILLIHRNRQLLIGTAPHEGLVAQVESLVSNQPEVESVKGVKAVVLGSGEVRFTADVDFAGEVIAARCLEGVDLEATLKELDSPEALKAYLEGFGEAVVEALGDSVDRIEKQAVEQVPSLVQIDLEAD